MDNNDFIREVKNLIDRFVAEWLVLNAKRKMEIAKDLEEMEKENAKDFLERKREEVLTSDEILEFDLKHKERD